MLFPFKITELLKAALRVFYENEPCWEVDTQVEIQISILLGSFTHLFIQHIFVEHLLYVSSCSATEIGIGTKCIIRVAFTQNIN